MGVGLIVRQHLRVFVSRTVGARLSRFSCLALLALLVFGGGLVEEVLAVVLDGLLVFLADPRWVDHPVLLVVALDQFLGCLLREPLQVIPGDFVLILVDDVLDVGVELGGVVSLVIISLFNGQHTVFS